MKSYQLFCDMDGVLVNFEGGVLAKMNSIFRLAVEDPSHKLHEVAIACSEEVGGPDVVLCEKHIEQGLIDDGLPGNVHARAFMKSLIGDDKEMWSNLEWELNGKVIWDAIKGVPGIQILSAPMEEGSRLGKRIWCERELAMTGSDVILADSKAGWGFKDNVLGILIDDRDKYINEFREAGGLAIKHNRKYPEATLSALRAFGII